MALPAHVEITNKHGRYCIPAGLEHRPGVKILLTGKVYEPFTIDFICRNAGQGDVIHAGAFCGDFLPALSKAVTGTVWAFEPVPEYFACAKRTIELNALENVRLMNAGLSSAPGNARMKRIDEHGQDYGGGSRIHEDGDLTIQTARLDDTIPTTRNVSIVHLDVEGHEREAVRGAMDIIRRCRPILILETDVGDQLAELGYAFRYRVHENVVYSVKKPQHLPQKESALITIPRRLKRRASSFLKKISSTR